MKVIIDWPFIATMISSPTFKVKINTTQENCKILKRINFLHIDEKTDFQIMLVLS